jgi:hypothetical protein
MGCVDMILEGLKWQVLANTERTFEFRKIERICILAKGLLSSRSGFGIMEFVSYKPSIIL